MPKPDPFARIAELEIKMEAMTRAISEKGGITRADLFLIERSIRAEQAAAAAKKVRANG